MDLFTIAAKITADTREFNQQLKSADSGGKSLAGSLEKTFSRVKKVIIGVASVAAVKKVTSSLFELASATATAGDRIDKQSQALGMSRKAFQEWDYILAQNGASIDSMGTSMKTLNEAIVGGGKEAQAALSKIGLSAKELSSLSQEQAFEKTVVALQKMPQGAQKSALAVKLLGKNAQQLMPLLNSSADSVEQLKERARELGMIMSDEAVDASVLFGDSLDDLKRTWTGLKNTLGSRLLPKITDGMIAVTHYAGKFSGYVRNAIDTGDWKGLFNNVIGDVQESASALWTRITDTVPQLWTNAQNALQESDSPFLRIIGELMGGITDAVKYIIENKEKFESVFNSVSETIGGIVTDGVEDVKKIFEWFNKHGIETEEVIAAIVAAFAVAKIASFVATLNPVMAIFGAIVATAGLIIANWDEIAAFFEKLWADVSTAATNAWNSVKEWVTTKIVDPIKTAWNGVVTTIKNAVAKINLAWVKVKTWVQENVIGPIKETWDTVTDKVAEVKDAINAKLEEIVEWFKSKVINPIKEAWDSIINPIKKWLGIKETKQVVIETEVQQKINSVMSSENPTAQGVADAMGFNLDDYYASLGKDGSHASGLGYVPFDGYRGILHRGELILNKSRADDYRNGNAGFDVSTFASAVMKAVRDGMEQANIRMDMDGETVARNTGRRQADAVRARRYATT